VTAVTQVTRQLQGGGVTDPSSPELSQPLHISVPARLSRAPLSVSPVRSVSLGGGALVDMPPTQHGEGGA